MGGSTKQVSLQHYAELVIPFQRVDWRGNHSELDAPEMSLGDCAQMFGNTRCDLMGVKGHMWA